MRSLGAKRVGRVAVSGRFSVLWQVAFSAGDGNMADRDDKRPGRPEARPIAGRLWPEKSSPAISHCGPRPMPKSLVKEKSEQEKEPPPPPGPDPEQDKT